MRLTDAAQKALDKARAEGMVDEGKRVNLPDSGSDDRHLSMPEKQFMWRVIGLAQEAGWRVYHVHFSQQSDPGYPDLTMVHAKRRQIIFAELKSEKGRPTGAQNRWMEDLVEAGALAFLWRPSDMPEISRILRGE